MKKQIKAMTCPQCQGQTQKVEVEKHTLIKGVNVSYTASLRRCDSCELELADIEEAAIMQERLADAYRHAAGLLRSKEIRHLRLEKELSQQALADELKVGIASIKRWESGVIQSKSMDNLLRMVLEDHPCNEHTGNREYSIPRIRLVLDSFQKCLGRPLLKKNDHMLYAAKYLWYADMVAHRDLGRSLTGATYAALPMGPQLNNYLDLVDEIFNADPFSAPLLTPAEEAIIDAIARRFPKNKTIYAAAHSEVIWKQCATGAIIPYTVAASLTEFPLSEDLSD